jgi:hypothetical protein
MCLTRCQLSARITTSLGGESIRGAGDDGAYGDGHEALLVNGGGIDGGTGAYFANADEDYMRSGRWRR